MSRSERLIIKNFSVLTDIDLTINKFNIVIGEQATGKSVLSKLVFFFQQNVPQVYTLTLLDKRNYDVFVKTLKKDFSTIFPEYFWEKQDFEISFYYRIDDTRVTIRRVSDSKAPEVELEISDRIKRRFDVISRGIEPRRIEKEVFKTFNTHITIFTPASRSFFSLVQKNIFSLSLLGISTDLFINQFGIYYERFKSLSAIKLSEIKKLFSDVLKGEFYFDQKLNEIFIYSDDNKKVRLSDASTGQQELVPVLILLNAILQEPELEHFLIIEEPGSHLFPSTQKKLMELFAMIFNYTDKKTGFLFTTHSPYILSSLNNLIEAGNVLKIAREKSVNVEQALSKIISPQKAVDFEDVSVFMIKNGKLVSLMDKDLRLVKSDLLDQASEEIAGEFSKLLELENRIENGNFTGV